MTVAIGPPAELDGVRELFRHYAASLPFSLDFQNFTEELASLPGPYAPPHGTILVAARAGAPVGIVALKRLEPAIAEIKRLYVVPAVRGSGLGILLLNRAIDAARERGYARVRLDSHRASMAPAIALYRRLGFVEIAPYGPDFDGAFAFFEKRL